MTVDVAPCSQEAARYAVMHWHYSRTMPVGKLVRFGAWEGGRYIGAVIFGRGATPNLLNRFGVKQTEGCELVRVALTTHEAPVSQIVSRAMAQLRAGSPGLRVVVSFADPGQGHRGGIYQAMNWIYTGAVEGGDWWRLNGGLLHPRSVVGKWSTQAVGWLRENVDPAAERVVLPAKHRYAYPFDRAMRRQLAALARPYPQ